MLCLCKEPAENVQQESIEEEPSAAIVSRSIYTIYIYWVLERLLALETCESSWNILLIF